MNEEVEKGEDDVFDRKVEREDTLVGKLLSRGLVVSDELQLRKIIRLVGYYRLTGYLYPFRQEGGEGYVKGTTLEQIWRLYTFDRRLRGCVMDALSRIEVAVRVSVMENHAAMFKGDPFVYARRENFPNFNDSRFEKFTDSLARAVKHARDSGESSVLHYLRDRNMSQVPVWVLMEVLAFGDVETYYSGLPLEAQRKVCDTYDVVPGVLKGWLKVLRRLRNICAHQGRLWNRKIDARISFDIAGRPELLDLFNAISPQKELRHTSMFVALCIARQMLKAVRPESKWADRLKSLLADYPEVPLAAMGFPADWQTLALWK